MKPALKKFWVGFHMPIIGLALLLAGYGCWKLLTFTKPVPQETVEYLNNACEEVGGGMLVGDWPVYAGGYLIDKKFRSVSNPIDRSEPFLVYGFRYIEYNLDVILGPRYKQKSPEGSGSKYVLVPFKGPYLRISVEETGHPNCGPFELERQYGSTQIPDHLCLAMMDFADPAQLWSRYKYQEYHDHDNSGPLPIRWSVTELVDRDTNRVQASVRHFMLCASKPVPVRAGGGFYGCVGQSRESPQLFSCPPPGRANSALARESVDTFLQKVIHSNDPLEDKE
jgi:hypothetical protein